ncbi:MAG: phenylalanine--tRNA ligase subunit alpha [Victivallales bacterium]|nr:phenylalanine--tRNA ligase subunit alpha [Victivallales bacterium]
MTELEEKLLATLAEAKDALAQAKASSAIEELRIKYLSRKGVMTALMGQMGTVPPADKPAVGKTLNLVKKQMEAAFQEATAALSDQSATAQAIDVTLPARLRALGHQHPITQVMEQAVAIFRRMGFVVADGPDLEDVWHNFDALNAPQDHPSRAVTDTFYFDLEHHDYLAKDTMILRTQTSPVQIRAMETHPAPVRIVCPGRCYRRDTPDATHGMSFHQIEGLYVDKKVSLADLKGTLSYYAKEMFGSNVKIRFRPHFFPFTEPSVEWDASCMACGGKGCKVCKGTGWIEISGAGMVNPQVLRNVGWDPEQLSGYAFGMGIERIAMIQYGINDLRLLYENDLRFLHQF